MSGDRIITPLAPALGRTETFIPFQFESHTIRTLTLDGEPWFVGKDVAEALGYKDTVNALKLHCKGVAKYHPLPTGGGTQDVRVINEPDVYRLITGSTLPKADTKSPSHGVIFLLRKEVFKTTSIFILKRYNLAFQSRVSYGKAKSFKNGSTLGTARI